MSQQRLIIQMAQAADLTGNDPQRAAERAVKRALSQAQIAAPETLGIDEADVLVRVTVAVPDPSALDAEALSSINTLGQSEIVVSEGGLLVEDPQSGATQIVATAAAEVFLPRQENWRLASAD